MNNQEKLVKIELILDLMEKQMKVEENFQKLVGSKPGDKLTKKYKEAMLHCFDLAFGTVLSGYMINFIYANDKSIIHNGEINKIETINDFMKFVKKV